PLQLRQLPFTELKIDRAFVSDSVRSRECRLIVQSVIDLAHGLGITATAEGIETIEQLRLLRELGCNLGQGYLLAQPLEPDDLGEWIEEFRKRWPQLIGEESLALWSDVETNTLG
ncbi:MAG TPA: EAL domain-containing protein, partial [Caulobacteraceae bacterium]|nr:EAL domain-containing protein [Caulobacteraceae bacterium]